MVESLGVFVKKARSDFKTAKALFELGDTDFYEKILFFCQQSVEKFLKAFLMKLNMDFPRTHDLEELFDLISSDDLVPYHHLVETLNEHAVILRYEEGEMLDKETVSDTLDTVGKFIDFIEKKIVTIQSISIIA